MWKGKFRDSEHLNDVALEGAGNIVEIYLREILAHELLGGVVDENVQFFIPGLSMR